ncbi:MAG: carbonate dehydratase [Bacteroidota bacterium]|nr:carbonate dehydratase [Bacteroidota bacterium]
MIKKIYNKLLEGNKDWASQKMKEDPKFFERHAEEQTPTFLWIGCSDSRVHPGEITNTEKGEIFVHRNIANMVVHTDLNMLSVLQYAVEVLKVKHVIVCGHYGCGGVIASMDNQDRGLVNKWLRNIKEVHFRHNKELLAIENLEERQNRLVELNVIDQVYNLAETSIIQKAWKNREVNIHGWVYDMKTGLIKELDTLVDDANKLDPIFRYNI